jgi:hypothetical protein
MRRLLMAAGSILLLTTVAHARPLGPRHPAHPTVFVLAGDDDSGSSDDASAADSADDGSAANGDAGVTDNGGEDPGADVGVAGAAPDGAGATPAGAPPGPPPPVPSFSSLQPLQGTGHRWIRAGVDAQ